jgi:steroid 5-alpha reductase family enzyme
MDINGFAFILATLMWLAGLGHGADAARAMKRWRETKDDRDEYALWIAALQAILLFLLSIAIMDQVST